jgi:hypothetical protein
VGADDPDRRRRPAHGRRARRRRASLRRGAGGHCTMVARDFGGPTVRGRSH